MTVIGLMVIAGLLLVVIGLTGLLLVRAEEDGERDEGTTSSVSADALPPSPEGEGLEEDNSNAEE